MTLLADLERATEGSRELDAKVAAELRILPKTAQSWMKNWAGGFAPYPDFKPGQVALIHSDGTPGVHWASAHYTTNLQDALLLVPEGLFLHMSRYSKGHEPRCDAHIYSERRDEFTADAATLPLALCIACLRAIAAEKERAA